MQRQNAKIDWDEIESAELKCWYFVSKIMGKILAGNFPYYTYRELLRQIQDDPNYKKKDED